MMETTLRLPPLAAFALILAAPAAAGAQDATPPLRSNLGLLGAHGPLRVVAAHAPPALSIGTGLTLEMLSKDDLIVEGDSNTRVVGTLGLSVVPDDNVELFLTLRARANRNSTSVPELIQALGETSFGVKGFAPIQPGISVGGLGRIELLNGQGELGWKGDATSVRVAGLATIDGRVFDPEAIVRAHLNLGYTFHNGHNLTDGKPLTAVEQFAGNVTEFDTLDVAIGVEVLPEDVTPFLEWHLGVPLGTRIDTSDVCVEGQPCPADEGFGAFPHWITLGVMGEVVPGLSLRGALDLGLQSTIVSGLPATPPYNVILGLAYDVGSAGPAREAAPPPPPVAVEKPVGRVRGRVVDSTTRQPLAEAKISYPETDKNAQLAGTDGIFMSYDLDPGAVRIEVSAEGYTTRAFQIPVGKSTVNFSFPLKPAAGIPGAPPGATPPDKKPDPPKAAKPPPKKVTPPAAPGGATPPPPPPPPPPKDPGAFDPLAP